MTGRIGQDADRFHRKVRKLMKGNFKHLLNRGAITVPKGDGTIKIPIERIETPRFKFDTRQRGGTGMGDGDVGDPLPGQKEKTGGDDGHGDSGGDPLYEESFNRKQLADLLGEMLELPQEYESEQGTIPEVRHKYNSIRRVGPHSLRHMRRTYKQALKRSIASGGYVPGQPIIITPADFRFKSSTDIIEEHTLGVFIHLMDASGSMEYALEEAKLLVDFTDLWLEQRYKGIIHHYIHYSHKSYEVDRDTFFSVTPGGGTDLATGLEHVLEVAAGYNGKNVDLYLEHITDGDYDSNGKKGLDGEERILRALKGSILPRFTGVYVADIPTYPMNDRYSDFLYKRFGPGGWADGKLRVAQFDTIDGVYDALRTFFRPLE